MVKTDFEIKYYKNGDLYEGNFENKDKNRMGKYS